MHSYQIYHNLDSHYMRGYEPGDRLATGYSGGIHPSRSLSNILELIYAQHNRDTRPDGRTAPSLSVGDVVVIGEAAATVSRVGFLPVVIDPRDLLGLTYMESVDLW